MKESQNAGNHMLCYNPNSSEVDVLPHPDVDRNSRKYERTLLACMPGVKKMSFEQRKSLVFIEAMHAIIRDYVDPFALHSALLKLEEYRSGCADDMPGISNRGKHA